MVGTGLHQAVELESADAEDCLPRGIRGLNAGLFREFVQHIADRRFEPIASGAATDVVIVTSSGYELLDDAAVKFARTWKFTPAYLGATPIESKVERPIRFKLRR